MSLNVPRELSALQHLTTQQLQLRYAEVFGETTRANHRTWLLKRILWRLQALAEGDLTERARRRAAELANDADLRLNPPRDKALTFPSEPACSAAPADHRLPSPGTLLTRPYKGQLLQVQVLADGFAFAGQVYRTLSAVAKAVTGTHCNGYHFFRAALSGQGGRS